MKKVGILEDNFGLRKNIETFLKMHSEYEIVFSEAKLLDVNLAAFTNTPDLILLDIHLKDDQNGLSLISNLFERYPEAAIIVMTGDKKDEYVIEAIENGVRGYLYKPFELELLKETLETVVTKCAYLQKECLAVLLQTITKRILDEDFKTTYALTNKELEVIGYLRRGFTYKQIANEMVVSYHTVNHHVKNIYFKLDVSSTGQLFSRYF